MMAWSLKPVCRDRHSLKITLRFGTMNNLNSWGLIFKEVLLIKRNLSLLRLTISGT